MSGATEPRGAGFRAREAGYRLCAAVDRSAIEVVPVRFFSLRKSHNSVLLRFVREME